MITFDQKKCVNCLLCTAVCPSSVLDDIDGKPFVREEKNCIECLHCAAVCPVQAVLFDEQPAILPESLPELPGDFARTLESYLLTVRSYRHFKPIPVEKELLAQAIQYSAWAPSAKNQHPTEWIIVNGDEKIKSIMDYILSFVKENQISAEIAAQYDQGNNMVVGNAKTLLFAHAKKSALNPTVDTAIALQNITLMLHAHGVGTCWGGYLTRLSNLIPEIRELLSLPEDHELFGAMMIGYPEGEKYLHIPKRIKSPKISWL
ncbi:nitroreductase [Clostridia bacterium]|nr:nitroreductase [Clostridia bacterium]